MERYLFIGLTLALTAYGQLIMKSRAIELSSLAADDDKLRYLVTMFRDKLVLSGLAAAVVASICWVLVLQKTNIGYAYPFMALSFILVPAASSFFFDEPLSNFQLVGLGLIVAGISINAVAQ